MGYREYTYLDFAKDDHKFFDAAYSDHIIGGPLASLGQSICEKYLKHIVSEYAEPENNGEQREKERVLRTHNLQILVKYIQEEMQIAVPDDVETGLDRINGFYFSTRYPGDDSFIASEKDIEKAKEAVELTKKFVDDICRETEKSVNEKLDQLESESRVTSVKATDDKIK